MNGRRWILPALLIGLAAGSVPTRARAAGEGAHAYALVVGSNRGGSGQKPLRFARHDARRVRRVLVELGGYSAERTKLLLDPRPAELRRVLARIRQRLERHARRGESSRFLFYYSGHARARALSMGSGELSLAVLRRQLAELPSTVAVVILDACQSGAISGIKGAAPAADFSHNSIADLDTSGLAVMASSSGTELSQEADQLGASYFTHNLVVGLRGAADGDGDGRVTLSEAYRYAYHRTLVATASTAVGKQHVTLETELRGKGEMVLTYPARASATLELPARLSAKVLVHREPQRTVVAELHKAPGKRVRLALPPGRYVALVRADGGGRPRRCELALHDGSSRALDAARCPEAPRTQVRAKGEPADSFERWGLELGVGGMWGHRDTYTATLDNFGFDRSGWFDSSAFPSLAVSLMVGLHRYVALAVGWTMLDRAEYTREVYQLDGERREQRFSWEAHAMGVYVRARYPLFDEILTPFVQVGGGLTWAQTVYRDPLQASVEIDDQLKWGGHLGMAAGALLMPWRRYFGFYAQATYLWAPTIGNEIDQTHDSGGIGFHLGVRGSL